VSAVPALGGLRSGAGANPPGFIFVHIGSHVQAARVTHNNQWLGQRARLRVFTRADIQLQGFARYRGAYSQTSDVCPPAVDLRFLLRDFSASYRDVRLPGT